MNKAQKAVQKASLNDEKRTIRELKQVYSQAKKDVEERIRNLSSRTDMENLQSIIYQKKYQEALKKQIDDVLDKLNTGQIDTVSEYLNVCYENGYVGAMYDLHNQGIPMTLPINQKKVVKALQTDTKLSSRKYKGNPLKGRLAEDIDKLKLSIRAELSRSVANGSSWNEVAVKIAKGMNNPFDKAYRSALLIARTEGHRVQQSATLDALHGAKDKGADVVKQWDSTLDGLTRPAHREADGQLRELDEFFDVGGEKMKAPAIGGSAKNVCNCRCVLLQRARWALDEAELETLKKRASFFGLDKNDSFEEFKKNYLKLPRNADTIKIETLKSISQTTDLSSFKKYIKDNYGFDVGSGFETLHFGSIKDCSEGFEDVLKEFPTVKQYFTAIETTKSGINSMSFGGALKFNPYYYEEDWFVAESSTARYTKDTSKHNAVYSNGSHEAGHLLELALIKKNNGTSLDWVDCTFGKKVCSEALKNAKKQTGKTYADLIYDVSDYAKADRSECMAECVADYMMNGEDASILSKEVWKILKRELR